MNNLNQAYEHLKDIVSYAYDMGYHELGYQPEKVLFEAATKPNLQEGVEPWMAVTFGAEVSGDMVERADRFLEEAFELVQSHGYDRSRIMTLVDYVYGRPDGEANQEVGGVMITLAAYCLAAGIDMHAAGDAELQRVWTKIEQIREKQAGKRHIHS